MHRSDKRAFVAISKLSFAHASGAVTASSRGPDLVNRLCGSIAMFRSVRVLLLDVIHPSQRRCSDSGARS
jgi:hypothetical protein